MFTLVLNALKRCKLILPKAVDVIEDEWYKNSHDAAEQVLAQDAVHMHGKYNRCVTCYF